MARREQRNASRALTIWGIELADGILIDLHTSEALVTRGFRDTSHPLYRSRYRFRGSRSFQARASCETAYRPSSLRAWLPGCVRRENLNSRAEKQASHISPAFPPRRVAPILLLRLAPIRTASLVRYQLPLGAALTWVNFQKKNDGPPPVRISRTSLVMRELSCASLCLMRAGSRRTTVRVAIRVFCC